MANGEGRQSVPQLRAIVADEQVLFSEVLAEALNLLPIITVIARTSDGVRLVQLVTQQQPDLVILDEQLPRVNGLEIIRTLRHRAPAIKVLVLTPQRSDEHLFACVRAGADGYLVKATTTIREINQALEALARGETYISQLSLQHAIQANVNRRPAGERTDMGDVLSVREREILRWLAKGLSTKDIARKSGISHTTVRNHISSMYRKLGVPTRAGLVLYALRTGVIAAPANP